MSERPVPVQIGGMVFSCPPMPFYCLELAWPHIRALSRMASASQTLRGAELQVTNAITPEEHKIATENFATASKIVEDLSADIMGQTSEALHVIAASLALDPDAPLQSDLAKLLRPDEIVGVHVACTEIIQASGLVTQGGSTTMGEAMAATAGQQSPNGTLSSLN